MLEYWSDLNNVFQFVRVEDIAYDKRPGMGNVVYIVDSGRGRTAAQSLDTNFRSTNGRVWKMVLDKNDPTKVTSLTVFVEGDDNPVKTLGEVHQPDNIETTQTGLLLTEDPGSSQQFTPAQIAADPANATTARLWYVPFYGCARGRRQGRPVRGRGPDRCRRPRARELGRMGVERDRRRLGGIRARRVPDQRPGAHALGGEGTG